jgi:aryl-alcohol dehydrogenase-like predicted oxidoreductase
VVDILELARSMGIHKLDTAPSYGSSEQKLGQCNLRDFKVTTKLSTIPLGERNIRGYIASQIEGSLKRLNVEHLHAVLFHNEMDLISKFSLTAMDELLDLKRQGIIGNIGISTYFQSDLRVVLDKFDVDVIQAPYSIIDQRLNGFIDCLANKNIQIQVRSIFLQGLLLMNVNEALKNCPAWETASLDWQNFLKAYNLTAYEASLFFVLSNKVIDDFVIGIDGISQLNTLFNVVAEFNGDFQYDVSSLESSIKELINPYMWRK